MGKKEKGTKQSTVKGGEKEREGKKERGRKTKRTGGSKGKRKGRERDEGQWKGREGRREEGTADLGSYSLRSSRSCASWKCPEICEEKIKALDKFLYLMLLMSLNSSDFHHQETYQSLN